MPELPEVETVVRGLRVLVGKRIAHVKVRQPKLVSVGPHVLPPQRVHTTQHVRAFCRAISGRRILAVHRRAKLILISLSGGWRLLVHLKMSGQMVIQRRGYAQQLVRLLNSPSAPLERLPYRHTHITLTFSDGTVLHYNDIRVFGTWRAVREVDIPLVTDLASYGPEPLAKDFTVSVLRRALLRRPKLALKVALLQQDILAGVGNIYADEVLFSARLHPGRTVQSVRMAEWKKLHQSLRTVLQKAIRTHGSSVGDFIRPDGRPGTYGRYHAVYGRKGEPCLRCTTPIVRTVFAGRGTHFCPVCQRPGGKRKSSPARERGRAGS